MEQTTQLTKRDQQWAAACSAILAIVGAIVTFAFAFNHSGMVGFLAGVAVTIVGLFVVPAALGLQQIRSLLIGYTIISMVVLWPIVLVIALIISPSG